MVHERRLRFRLLDQADREPRLVRRGGDPRCRRPPGQPVAGAPAVAATDRRRPRLAPRLRRSPQRSGCPGRRAPARTPRFAVRRWTWRVRPSAGRRLRDRRPARPVAARRRRAGRSRHPHRHRGRRLRRCCLADGPAVGQPGPVLSRRGDAGHRSRSSARTSASSCSSCPSCASSRACSTGWSWRRCSSRWPSTWSRHRAAASSSRPRSGSTSRSWPACSCCRWRSATSSTSSSSSTAPAASRPASASPTRTPSSSPTTC